MKSKMSWKGVLISLSVLILFVGIYGMAIGNISFPYTFTAGTAAKASEVNGNFSAINLRQVASAASMTGDFYVKNLEVYRTEAPVNDPLYKREANCNCTCSSTFSGTLTLKADGTVEGSGQSSEQCGCVSNCCIYTYNISITGTYTVSSDGSGVLDLTYVQNPGSPKTELTYDRTFAFQASKDLNTLIINATDDKNSLGTALRK